MAETLPTLDPIYRGDDFTIKVTATWPVDVPERGVSEGDPYPLTGKTIYFTAKHKTREDDASAEFQISTDDGIAVDDTDAHVCYVSGLSSHTADMTKGATLVCDVQVSGAETWTVWKGNLPVYEDVTRTTP